MNRLMSIFAVVACMAVFGCEQEQPKEVVAQYEDATLKVQISSHGPGVYLFQSTQGSFTNISFADTLGRFVREHPNERVTCVTVVVGHGRYEFVHEVLVVTEERSIEKEK